MYHLTRALVVVLALTFSVVLKAELVFTSGSPNQVDGLDLTEFIVASNFVLTSSATLTAATFWASANVDPFPSQFSGSVGWGIFTDVGGIPGNLIASAADNDPTLVDTGVAILGTEEWTVGFELPSLTLSSGSYWLGLHEGAFGTPDDGSSIFWDTTSNQSPYPAMVTADLSGASGWIPGDGSALAFQLDGSNMTTLSSSAPEPKMLLPLGLFLCLVILVPKKILGVDVWIMERTSPRGATVQFRALEVSKNLLLRYLVFVPLLVFPFAPTCRAISVSISDGPISSVVGATMTNLENGLPSNFSLAGPNAGIESGSVINVRRQPTPNNGPYAYVGPESTITAAFLGGINYIGFDWGSPDVYNSVIFVDSDGLKTVYGQGGTPLSGLDTGQTSAQYVNFFTNGSPILTVTWASSAPAFEFDELATLATGSQTPMQNSASEPPSSAVFIAGLAAVVLGAMRESARKLIHRASTLG